MRIATLVALLATLPVGLAAQVGSPAGPVPPAVLAARRAALARAMENGVAIIQSARERSIESDYPQDSDYRESNDFFYLTGLEAKDSWLVVVADSGQGESVLFLPARDSLQERWTGPTLGPGEEASRITGIEATRNADSADAYVRQVVAMRTWGNRPGPVWVDRTSRGADTPLLRHLAFGATRDEALPALLNVGALVAGLRLVKDAEELRRLRLAIDITGEALVEAMRAIRPGMYEYEIEAVIEQGFRKRGAERVGFPSIVGSGPNSTVLHYDKSRRRTEAGELVVMDVGAEYGYYTADVTRTVPVNGTFTPRQRELYNLVLATQQAAMDSVRPGITVRDLNRIARAYMKANSGTLCGEAPCDRHFVHGLSHWLGMDVHDVGAYGMPLQAGMVLTVEPGIYIPAENTGIRIEDDVLVTATGHELLSGRAPRAASEIEKVMRSRR